MTCITCHNHHKSIEVTGREQYNNACINCHNDPGEVHCSLPEAGRLAENNDCSGCHMPRSGSIDIPHVNITDHYISKGNTRMSAPGKLSTGAASFLGLEILTKEEGTALELAKGYLAMYDKYVQSPMVLDSAGVYLQMSIAPFSERFPVEIHYLFAREDHAGILKRSAGKQPAEVTDAWTAYRIGEAFYQAGDFQQAAAFFRRADVLMPYHLDFKEKLGAALVQLRQLPEAEEALRWVLQENPKRPKALSNLGFARVLQGAAEEAERYYDQAITLDPDYVQALLNKAAVRLLKQDYKTAEEILKRVLRLEPEHPQAVAILQQLNQPQ
jgi:tetratricopeptide (TPR) repeat protein